MSGWRLAKETWRGREVNFRYFFLKLYDRVQYVYFLKLYDVYDMCIFLKLYDRVWCDL